MEHDLCRLQFISLSLVLFQAFAAYMRSRAHRPPVVVRGFDPLAAAARYSGRRMCFTVLKGESASPPVFSDLPSPADVLAGKALPNFGALRLGAQTSFRSGLLNEHFHVWEALMESVEAFGEIKGWLRDGVHLPSFFQHFEGVFNGRHFDSDSPPPMYFQNAPVCYEYADFITKTIVSRLEEGSMRVLGRVGIDPPPHVVNALSVEPIKPRLVLSMRAVNLFCRDCPFRLTPLSDIVKNIQPQDFFTSFDDIQGYKQISLSQESFQFCGFEWAGWWFCDTALPFGWKNSAYVYTSVGEVLSSWLRGQGMNTDLWIDDRFLGLAPCV